MTSSIETLTIPEFGMLSEDTNGENSIEDSHPEQLRRSCDPSFERIPMPLHNESNSSGSNSGQFSLSLVAASLLHRTMAKPKKTLSSPSAITTREDSHLATKPETRPNSNRCTLLESVPKEVLARDILGFLTDKGVKVFFDSLGEERLQSPSFSELRSQFCLRHGSKLEDPESFLSNTIDDDQGDSHQSSNKKSHGNKPLVKPGSRRKRCCPECHAEQQQTKRCHGCKVFYPNSRERDANNKAFPGLWCQKCDHMAFCNNCLSSKDSCGSAVLATTLSASFGRKHRLCNHNHNRASSCHNYCCPNVFTNTMCGEFVCLDCSDENQKLLRNSDEPLCRYDGSAVETCEECGKSTCLDPHCLVCADFKLIHMSCKFSPEDAYKVDIGGILFGSKNNGSNLNLSTKLRRNLSDCVVWIFVLMALSKMWWFQKQQQQQEL